ncbi:MAG: hypothetical protein POELPBGB_02936 [Bacteroidia bacterium]|nr:hypothetical protein [Bacteroidia bacterium]
MFKYFFTTFGDVYFGFEFDQHLFPNHKIIIPGTSRQRYLELKPAEKTIEKIKELGFIVKKSAIVKIIQEHQFPLIPQNYNYDVEWNEKFKRKYIFIFGAGASANCAYGGSRLDFDMDAGKPPLGTGLFSSNFHDIIQNYPGVKQSLMHIRQENVDVEALFETEWKEVQENGNSTFMSRHINIQFYLQELIEKISSHVSNKYYDENLYALFADKLQTIHNRDTTNQYAFVSFNYDTLLEYFLQEIFFGEQIITSFDQYVQVNNFPFCIFKPHGSWDWGWQFPKDIWNKIVGYTSIPNWLFKKQINFHTLYNEILGNEFEIIDWSGWGLECMINKYQLGRYSIDKSQMSIRGQNATGPFYPALLLPYRDKDEFTMPPKHYLTLHSYLGEVETIIIIGWKGNEEAFNRLMEEQTHRLRKIVIADPNPKVVNENLKKIITKKDIEIVHYSGFEEFVKVGMEKELNLSL